jgi:hypothetical protein
MTSICGWNAEDDGHEAVGDEVDMTVLMTGAAATHARMSVSMQSLLVD